VEDKVVAQSSIYFLVVDHRGEHWASSCACEGRDTGSDVDFSTEIGNANDNKQNTG
jgi:hypothetical protein